MEYVTNYAKPITFQTTDIGNRSMITIISRKIQTTRIIRKINKLVVMKKRKTYTSGFKTKVVLEALRERESIQELGKKHDKHPNQISI